MKKESITKSNKFLLFYAGWLFTFILMSSASAEDWVQKSDMPIPRLFFSTTAVDGQLYTIGGMLAEPVDFVDAYDPDADKWGSESESASSTRAGVVTCVVNEKIYAIGGWSSQAPALGTVEEYDPATDTWTQKADMPTPRSFFTATAVGGKIYAIGGVAQNVGPVLPIVEEYNPATDTWTQKADMPTTDFRNGSRKH